MDSIKISVVTVCRNSEIVLSKTIESVLRQTYDNIEYIIIDGKSDDRTVSIAESYRQSFNERGYSYKIISEPDQGIYDAMNKGTRMASGELIGFINSGDWYEPQATKRVAEVYGNTGFDMFYGDLRIYKKTGIMIKRAKISQFVTTRNWNHPTTFIRATLYQKYQYACRGIYDDWDLVLKIQNSGYKVVVRNEVLANFCFGGISNQKNLGQMVRRMNERYRIYRDNGYSRLYVFECVLMEVVKYLVA